MKSAIVIFTCLCTCLFNVCLLICCTYLTIKFDNLWCMLFLFFMRDFKYNTKSDDEEKDKDKEEEP